MNTINVSVSALAEFSARSGDLYGEVSGGPTAKEGQEAHKRVQQTRGEEWQAEKKLVLEVTHLSRRIRLSGRADLVRREPPLVEEIKSTFFAPEQLPEAKKSCDLAQAKLYAFMYCSEHALKSIEVQLSYFQINTQSLHEEACTYGFQELKEEVYEWIESYIEWINLVETRKKTTMQVATSLHFPFPTFREGQLLFSRHVYRCIKDNIHFLAEAPTGTGKTLSALFPAIKAMGDKLTSQICYLSNKGSVQANALAALAKCEIQVCDDDEISEDKKKEAISVDYIAIHAKAKVCACRIQNENAIPAFQLTEPGQNSDASPNTESVKCSRTVGFYDRLPKARAEAMANGRLDADTLKIIAERHHLCPFELSLQLLPWMSVAICDVNYVFDPLVQLPHFDKRASKRVFLIDEAHNLMDRAKDMYSSVLDITNSRKLHKQLPKHYKASIAAIKRWIKSIESLGSTMSATNENVQKLPFTSDCEIVYVDGGALSKTLFSITRHLCQELQLDSLLDFANLRPSLPAFFEDWLKSVVRCLAISELASSQLTPSPYYLIKKYSSLNANGKLLEVCLYCTDASGFLAQHYSKARASILFSATLRPIQYYAKQCGLLETKIFDAAKAPEFLQLPSAFPSENQLTLRCDYIDTRFRKREQSLPSLLALVKNLYDAKPSRYIVFFPSYQYLETVYSAFCQKFPEISCIRQHPGEDDLARQRFMAAFMSKTQALVGFAILGGIYGEGVDFKGDSLEGLIVIGAGMPQPNARANSLTHYLARRDVKNSHELVYQYPGFTRVQQTVGRLIRAEKERGVVILVDPRFSQAAFTSLYPRHWQVKSCHTQEETVEMMKAFWMQSPKEPESH